MASCEGGDCLRVLAPGLIGSYNSLEFIMSNGVNSSLVSF